MSGGGTRPEAADSKSSWVAPAAVARSIAPTIACAAGLSRASGASAGTFAAMSAIADRADVFSSDDASLGATPSKGLLIEPGG